jgi:hypothetical protein
VEITAAEKKRILLLRRWYDKNQVMVIVSFNTEEADIHIPPPKKGGRKF